MNEFYVLIVALTVIIGYSILGIIIADAGWSVTKEVVPESSWVKILEKFEKKSIVGFRLMTFFLWPLIIIVGLLWVFFVDGLIFIARFLSGKTSA